MYWLLLNQYYVHMGLGKSEVSVLESVVSSEEQLVQVLVSGNISSETMTSLSHGQKWNNLEFPIEECLS